MSRYAEILKNEDPRIAQMFNVETETHASGSALIDDPFPGLARLLEKAPVYKGMAASLLGLPENQMFHVPSEVTYTALSFPAVSRALIENEVFSSRVYDSLPGNAQLGGTILHKVGLEHRGMRDAIQPMFSPEAAQTWWDDKIIAETVEVLISKIEGRGQADLFLELCARMPVHVVSAGFGIAPDDILPFRMALLGASEHGERDADRTSGMAKSRQMMLDVIKARRESPQDDVISRLVTAEVTTPDGGKRPFTDDEIVGNCRLILLAGGGTTWRQLGITIFALLNNPEQFEAFKADRSLAPRVVLESARWHATDLIFPRRVEQDVTLEGVDIPKGAMLHMCLGAANRDANRWEDPDRFDIMRPVQRALAFGGGPHSCLGQHVSRQEMVVALNAIMDRLPNLRWDPSKPPARLVGGLFQRGPSALPVVFD